MAAKGCYRSRPKAETETENKLSLRLKIVRSEDNIYDKYTILQKIPSTFSDR